ncbi:piggyBac transposable element-derived protein 4 [Biomphalaria glabrata]|nr:piggyBac transposable element-derived protein 4 [Biomphalaria glabrata]
MYIYCILYTVIHPSSSKSSPVLPAFLNSSAFMSGDAEDVLVKQSLITHDDDSDHSSGSHTLESEDESSCNTSSLESPGLTSSSDSELDEMLPQNQGSQLLNTYGMGSCSNHLRISSSGEISLWQLIVLWIFLLIKKCLSILNCNIQWTWASENWNHESGFKSYLDLDDAEDVTIPKFQPNGIPGLVLMEDKTKIDREKFLTPGAFFKLFFPLDLVQKICDYTNENFDANQALRPKLAVGWTPVTPDEMYSFIALIIYCSTITLADMELYWFKEEEVSLGLFSHIWASSIMSKERYKQIQTFLKVENTKQPKDRSKLRNIKPLVEQIRLTCMKHWTPNEYIRIEERVVEDSDSKHGVRLWHVQDVVSGYFWNFDFYLGKTKNIELGGWWRGTVMKLCSPLYGQGYKLFVDNVFNSVQLFKDLFENGIGTCGTISTQQVGFPDCLKDIREFQMSDRGTMRWVREGNLVFVQWKDRHVANVTSTMHKPANEQTVCIRKVKAYGRRQKVEVKQPVVIKDFLQYFGDKDRSEDVIEKFTHLMRRVQFWKTVFYHMIEVARSNSFVMFQHFRNLDENKDVEKLARPKDFKEIDFTIELVQELAQIKV